ncbi:MAG: F0F1 ATP synthase subunit A, partial [Caldilineaceae bacterium]|nr:F0F1 ATP synthase subunit A [Caldilineaceae bacterium]
MLERLIARLALFLDKYVLQKIAFLNKVPVLKNPTGFSILLLIIITLFVGQLITSLFPVPPPHVSLAAEPILAGGPKWLTNAMLSLVIIDILVLGFAFLAAAGLGLLPKNNWANLMEMLVEALYNLTESVAGHNSRKFFPWVATIFLLVIVSNYFGLLPGVGSIVVIHGVEAEHAMDSANLLATTDPALVASVAAAEEEGHGKQVPLFRSPSADLNFTLGLAFISVIMTQVFGVQSLGMKYFGKFFQNPFKNTMGFVVGLFELIAEISKLISFSFRLFGN